MSEDVLRVNEVFESFQGEANFTGQPAVFIRLQGCDVGCPWCDTKHTWAIDPRRVISEDMMLAKTADTAGFAELTARSLAGLVAGKFTAKHVVITGGEPCIYDLTDLTEALHALGRRTQIETSGTQRISASWKTWVTVSPKIDMPGGFKVLRESMMRANEIKLPVGKPDDIMRLSQFLQREGIHLNGRNIWLQPLSESEKATALCIEMATKLDWRVSLQTHKFVGVR